MFRLIFVLYILSSTNGASEALHAPHPIQINEVQLVQSFMKSSPAFLDIQIQDEQQKLSEFRLKESYQWRLITSGNYQNSSEKPLSNFAPTFGPNYNYSTSLEKQFRGGLKFATKVFANQQSTLDKSVDESTRTGVNVSLGIDLWKNLFGRVDRAQTKNQEILGQKSKLQKQINKNVALLEIRKAYWSLVANQEKQNITNRLLKAAKQQLQDAQKRKSQHIADKGEIARFKTQVATQTATLDSLRLEQETISQAIKEQIPELSAKTIQLGPHDIKAKINEVLVCTARIQKTKKIPWNYTQLDEVIKLVEQSYIQKQTIVNRHSDIDVQLVSEYQSSGVEKGFSKSYTDFNDNAKSGTAVGLTVTIPLGSSTKDSEKSQLHIEKNLFLSEKNRLIAEVQSRHTQVVKLIGHLNSASQEIDKNTQSLQDVIKDSQKKYKQARIPLKDLISDQNALLNNQLNSIDTKLQVIHTLLDYFKVFNDDPCTVNKVGA